MAMQQKLFITPGLCDFSGRLGLYDTFVLFMDIAAQHAEQLGVGNAAMAEKGYFWLTVRTVVRFHQMPRMMEPVTVKTWPGVPERAYTDRYYTLSQDDRLLIEGKTKWAVLQTQTGRIASLHDPFFSVIPPEPQTVCDGPQTRIDENFSKDLLLGTYTVSAIDIDIGGHMNNAAYLRAAERFFTTAQRAAVCISSLDISFRAPCYEGEVLQVMWRRTECGAEIGMLRPDGKAAAVIDCRFTPVETEH